MITRILNFSADQPALFSWLRKIIEINFCKQKQVIKEVFDLSSSKKILDIGCGTGEFAGLFNQLDYYGIDIASNYIKYATRKKQGNFKVMDATNLKFPDNSFDYILIMAILHHLNDSYVNKILLEAKRVLKPRGKVLIMENAKIDNLENWIIKLIQKFDKGDFIRSLEQYKNIITKHFIITREQPFRNGGCTYCSLVLKK